MIWQDLLFDRAIEDEALRLALTGVFAVLPEQIEIAELVTPEIARNGTSRRILVERFMTAGDFPLQVSIYLLDDALARSVRSRRASRQAISDLCARLDTTCLMSDNSPSVLTMRHIDGAGRVKTVHLDEDALDRDEYRLAVVRSHRSA